jgi:hypothetical protein
VTVVKGFAIILLSMLAFAVGGGLIGYGLGAFAPDYYHSTFGHGPQVQLNPVALGLGLGVTQGLICGLVAGSVVVLAVAWANSRQVETSE